MSLQGDERLSDISQLDSGRMGLRRQESTASAHSGGGLRSAMRGSRTSVQWVDEVVDEKIRELADIKFFESHSECGSVTIEAGDRHSKFAAQVGPDTTNAAAAPYARPPYALLTTLPLHAHATALFLLSGLQRETRHACTFFAHLNVFFWRRTKSLL